MKKLSKKSKDFIELFLSLDDMESVSLIKHDVKILYEYYNNAINEINRLDYLAREGILKKDNEIERLNNIINELEKWLKEKQILYGINQQGFSWGICGEALNKLQELKELKENK